MTALDEAETWARRKLKHLYRAAAAERQVRQLNKYIARQHQKALSARDQEVRAREAEAEARARAALAAVEEDSHDGR